VAEKNSFSYIKNIGNLGWDYDTNFNYLITIIKGISRTGVIKDQINGKMAYGAVAGLREEIT
jgi:hypothetical protein